MKYGSVKAVKQLAALMAAQKVVPTEEFTRYTGIVDEEKAAVDVIGR